MCATTVALMKDPKHDISTTMPAPDFVGGGQILYVDMSTQIHSDLDIELLKRTPSAFLGSCRYKLPEIHENMEIYDRIFEILDKLEIDSFIYIGGNDSMDTIRKLSDYAIVKGHKQKFLGVPKTIDNDLALTDHTPGFGSAAKYIAAST